MPIYKPTYYPDGSNIGDTNNITLTKANISDAIRVSGYAYLAALAAQEYNEMFKEFGQWTKWIEQQITRLSPLVSTLEGFGFYTDLGLTAGNVSVDGVGAHTVTIVRSKYYRNQNNVHFELALSIDNASGASDIAVNLSGMSAEAQPATGYVGAVFNWPVPVVLATAPSFRYANFTSGGGHNILNIGGDALGSGVVFVTVSIDYEGA